MKCRVQFNDVNRALLAGAALGALIYLAIALQSEILLGALVMYAAETRGYLFRSKAQKPGDEPDGPQP